MADQPLQITCPRCGHTWSVDLAELEKRALVIYRATAPQKRYRVQCPRCDTHVIVSVAFEEEDDA